MPQRFLIDPVEYEQRRSCFDLCRWINQKLEDMRATGNFDELYFERSDPTSNVKKLIEEAIPLSRLGLFLSTPGSEVYLTCYADNGNRDALVEITGFNNRAFKVEITTTEDENSTHRRQALARYGHVPLTGTVSKSGREITSSGEMICADAEDERCISLMLERLQRKADSRRYDRETAILVFFTEFRTIDPQYRARLALRTQRYLLEKQPEVRDVYYCYTTDYSIDHVRAA